jgi:ATP-dependent exoDNAse (exonuclease V) beta subunit
LVNTCDEVPLFGVLRGPLVGLSDEELYRIGPTGWRRIFEERFGELRQLAGFLPPDRLLAQALDECGYGQTLSERANANVDKLLAWLRREFLSRPRPLAELLEDLEALRSSKSTPDAPPPDAGNVVRIMTIHASKGLEFPAVFVCGLNKAPDRRTAPMLFSRGLGLGAKWLHPATGEGVPDPTHAASKLQQSQREEEEASRLLYVAMTRAERHLILTHAEGRGKSPWEKAAIHALPDAVVAAVPPEVPSTHCEEQFTHETFLALPLQPPQVDSTASVTSVAIFAACPRRYYLSRYLGLEPPVDAPGTGAIAVGLAVHSILAGQPVDSPEAH